MNKNLLQNQQLSLVNMDRVKLLKHQLSLVIMDRVELLKQQPLMVGLSEEELYLLSQLLEEKTYKPGALIIVEKEVSDDIYFIIEGEVHIQKWNKSSQDWQLVGKLKKGDMFGEMAFLDSSPRSSSVKAATETTVLKLSKAKLDITSIYNKIVRNIALINTNRLRIITQKYVNSQENDGNFDEE